MKTLGSLDVAGSFAASGTISPSQITSSQNDYNPTGLSAASVLRLSTDASRTITGLSGGAAGRWMAIHNVGSNAIVLANASVSSSASNRFALSADITLAANDVCLLQYDSTSSRWRCVGKSAGAGAVATDAIFDAKGDLAVGTGADAAQKLAVGTNGQSLVADSGQTTGLKYAWTGLVQAAFAESTTGLTGSTAIPVDDTVPQSGEGIEVITCAITPKSTSHKLKITLNAYFINAGGAIKTLSIALFRDSDANALRSTLVAGLPNSASFSGPVIFYVSPTSTSSETYKFRAGLADTSTFYVNRNSSGSLLSTSDPIQMIVEEIAQ